MRCLSEKLLRNSGIIIVAVAVALLVVNLCLTVPLYTATPAVYYTQEDGVVSPAFLAQLTSEPQTNTISVSGTATVHGTPNQAQVSLSVQTSANTAKAAQIENAEKMTAVIDALKAAGVAEENIETTGFSVSPVWQQPDKYGSDDETVQIIGYIVRNSIVVTITDLEAIGGLIDSAVAVGVNQVSGISFTLSEGEFTTLKNMAITKAVEDAKAKVELIAEAAGVKIVGPTSLNIGSIYEPSQYKTFGAEATAIETPILPGEVDVTVTVQAVYAFE